MIQEINLTAIIITAIICLTIYAMSRDDTEKRTPGRRQQEGHEKRPGGSRPGKRKGDIGKWKRM